MRLIDVLLPEFDREMGTTLRVLERAPDGALEWKPHDTSMTLAELARHVADLPRWTAHVMNHHSFDIAAGERISSAAPTSTAELLSRFDQNVASARALLPDTIDGALTEPWTLTRGKQELFTLPKIAMLRYLVLNHLIHHRGQLSVYLRLQGVAIPAIYGPSADEGRLP